MPTTVPTAQCQIVYKKRTLHCPDAIDLSVLCLSRCVLMCVCVCGCACVCVCVCVLVCVRYVCELTINLQFRIRSTLIIGTSAEIKKI